MHTEHQTSEPSRFEKREQICSIIGHGIDMVSIEWMRLELESTTKSWLGQFFSTDERAAADQPSVHIRYYAGRFAGKEAVAKALGTGFANDITWRGIEILRKESGAPYVKLSNEVKAFAESLGITEWFISISYSGDLAYSSVIAIGND
ncbi:MAG: holo-ACP synthase [Pirellulales bacterium]